MRRLLRSFTYLFFAIFLMPVLYAQPPHPKAAGLRPDAPVYAKHGPYWVGTQEMDFQTHGGNSGQGDRKLQAFWWYPALNPQGKNEDLRHGIQNAPPDPSSAPYPLVVLLHCKVGSPVYYHHLLAHLASYGMVVLAVDYQKNLVPSLVPQTLDFAASLNKAGTPFQGLLDPGRVGMVGHSLGARITARMAGAPLDPNAPPLPQDPRVKAIVLADPDVAYGPANAFDAVKLPAMVMLVTIQAFISLEDGKMVYETLPTKEKSLVVFPHGDHDFIQDPDQPSRYRITDLTCHFTTAFLLATLKSNAQARAALLPGAVHFPEVRYTTAFPGR